MAYPQSLTDNVDQITIQNNENFMLYQVERKPSKKTTTKFLKQKIGTGNLLKDNSGRCDKTYII